MSDLINTELLESVAELIDEFPKGAYTEALEQALEANDLELLYQLKNQLEGYCRACGGLLTSYCNNADCLSLEMIEQTL